MGIDEPLRLLHLVPRREVRLETAEDGIVGRVSEAEPFVIDRGFPVGFARELIFAEATRLRRAKGPVYFEGKKPMHHLLEKGMLNEVGGKGVAKPIIQVPAVRLDEIDIGDDQPIEVPVVDTPDDCVLLLAGEIRVAQTEMVGAEGGAVKTETTPVIPLTLGWVEEAAHPSLATVEKAHELTIIDGREELGPAILSRPELAGITSEGDVIKGPRGAETGAVPADKPLQPATAAVAVVVKAAAGSAGLGVVGLAQVVGKDHVSIPQGQHS